MEGLIVTIVVLTIATIIGFKIRRVVKNHEIRKEAREIKQLANQVQKAKLEAEHKRLISKNKPIEKDTISKGVA